MKSPTGFLAVILASFALFFTGCSGGDSHEKVVDDVAKQMDRMATAMSSVTDKATAEKAVAELKNVAQEMKKIGERAKALGQPSADVKAKLEAKMKAKQDEIEKRMAGSQASLMKAGQEAGEILIKGMLEVGPAMEEAGEIFKAADKK
jgi:hypothetical protein